MDSFEGFTVLDHALFIYNNSGDWSDAREYLHNSRMLDGAPAEYITSVYDAVCQLNKTRGYFR